MKFEDIKKAYLITPEGEVINKKTGKYKKTFISNSGYKRVTLWINGIQKKMSVHRLVAQAYIPNPHNYSQVNHIDGNKLNNCVDNLEWCNQSYNLKHAYTTNLIKHKTTKINQYDLNMKLIKQWKSINEASLKLKINHANIITAAKHNTNRKQAGGYIWKYVEGE